MPTMTIADNAKSSSNTNESTAGKSIDFLIGDEFAPGFSSALSKRLQSSLTKFDAFINSTMSRVEDSCKENTKLVREKQGEIDSLQQVLRQIKMDRGVLGSANSGVAAQKASIEETQLKMELDKEKLNQQVESIQMEVDILSKEKENYQQKVNIVREQKKAIELQKETKIEDLTKGVMLYTRLGLDFERIKDDLWFRFTYLDPKDPLRQFSFSLTMTNNDTYQVNACEPELPKESILAIVRQLNSASHGSCNAIPAFVRSMRREFKKHYV